MYDFFIGSSVETLGGSLSLNPAKGGGDYMANLDNNPDDRLKNGKTDKQKPKKGIDSQVAINFDFLNNNSQSTTDKKQAKNFTTSFHELAEAYGKVENSKQYAKAHQEAIDRENLLRDQRPYLKEYNPGSGPGNKIIIKK